MPKIDSHRWFPCLLLLGFSGTTSGVFAQQPASQAPAQAAAPPSQAPATASVLVPPSPEELGDTLMAEQRYQAAIEAYKKGPRNSAVLQNKLGIAYQMLLNVPEARSCYQASLKLDPHNAKVMNNLGTIYDSQQLYSAAERMYRKALKIEPRSAVIEKNLGTVLMAQHKYKKGAEAYQAALAMDPKIFEKNLYPRVDNPATTQDRGAMNYYMARSCVRAGLNDRAIEYLRMALNEGFTNPKKIIADSEFAALRGLPAFEQLMAAQGTP
jgi:tetratricopeptide (TPR) repeat protein